MLKIGAVLNNASGTLSPEEAKNRLEEIMRHLEKRVCPGCLSVVSGSRIGQEVERLKNQGIDVLIIGGGDGSISTAAKILKDTGIRLAVLGIGTRNHFARDLGIPLDPMEAIRLLDRMQVQQIDLGEVNGHTFINNATVGLYPRLVKEREERTKKHGWKKWRAQMVAALIVLWKLPRMRLMVKAEQFQVSRIMPFLFVGNNEYDGLINSDSSRSSLSDGRLWLCMTRSSGPLSLLRMVWQLSLGGIQSADNLETRLVTAATVHSWKKRITVAIDGENHKLTTPLQFGIRKKSLQVVVP